MKTGKSLVELALEIGRQRELKADYLADTRQMLMTNATPELMLWLRGGDLEPFRLSETAHDQN